MQRNLKWRYGGTLAALALLAWACSDEQQHPVAPPVPSVPVFGASVPGPNGVGGACMAKDAYLAGSVPGVNDSLDLADPDKNCTSNDIRIARADIVSFSVTGVGGTQINYTGQPITCNPGDTIFAVMNAILQETATSERLDIGVWISVDGGNARTGKCNHYNLINGAGNLASQDGGDSCGDMNNATGATVPLGILPLICSPSQNADSVHVGACLGWTAPGGDRVCPRTGGGISTDNGFRWGTVPGATSKCNCNGFNVPIIVNKTAKLEVRKVCDPTNDPGTFDLLRDDTVRVDNGACGSTTGSVTVAAGTSVSPGATHTFGEADFTAANYTSTRTCANRVGGAVRLASAAGTSGSVTLQPDDDVICTLTNTRKPGKIELKKALSPSSDAGLFNLAIKAGSSAGSTVASATDVGDGGTTGASGTSLPVGTYNLSESAGTGTSLADYTVTGPPCVNRVGGGSVTVTSGNVSLDSNDDIVCTITNTRNPGKLELKKALSPTSDPGLFNLFVKAGSSAGSTMASVDNVGNNGTTGAGGTSLAPGTYNLSEIAGTGTSLGDYTVTGPSCVNRVGGGSVTVTSGNVVLASNADVVCTITNTRNPGKLELKKALSPTDDPGKFNLAIKAGSSAGSVVASVSDVGNNGTTGAGGTSLAPGAYNLGETEGTGTSLGDYTVAGPSCVNRVGGGSVTVTSGNVDLASNADVVCTITNTRNTGKLELKKALVPTTDGGLFNLFIKAGSFAGSTVASATDVGNDGTTGASGTTLNTGTYNLSEAAGTGTTLTEYSLSEPVCVNRVGGSSVTVTGGNVVLAKDADVVCTITNTRKARLLITKTIAGTLSTSALFDFSRVAGTTYSSTASLALSNGGSNDSGYSLIPGVYTVCELNVAVALDVSVTVEGSSGTLTDTDPVGAMTNLCLQVTLGAGDTKTVAYTNSLVAGTGGTRTIGYWKNWASCSRSNGKQFEKATALGGVGIEFTLDGNIGTSAPSIYPIGDITVLTCIQAVNLLSKDAIDGTKRAGDPIYNMVAQLLGAKLNIHAGSGTCDLMSASGGYLDRAQTLLDALNFTGLNTWPKKGSGALSSADVTEANFLGGKFGSYNEGTLGSGCPTHV